MHLVGMLTLSLLLLTEFCIIQILVLDLSTIAFTLYTILYKSLPTVNFTYYHYYITLFMYIKCSTIVSIK